MIYFAERIWRLDRFASQPQLQKSRSQTLQPLEVGLQDVQEQSVIDIGTEALVWQGRPAPRCFTFRHWGRSLFWLAVLVIAVVWQFAGWTIYADSGQVVWTLIPLPLWVLAFSLSVGRVVRARLEWEHVFYVLSAERLRIQAGIPRRILRFNLDELSYVRLDLYRSNSKNKKHGCDGFCASGLGKLYLEFGNKKVVLSCIEHAASVFEHLQRHIDTRPD